MTYYRTKTRGLLVTSDIADDPLMADQIEPVPDLTEDDLINQYNVVLRIQQAMADNAWPSDLNVENTIRSGRLLYFPDGYAQTEDPSAPILDSEKVVSE